MKIRYVQTGWLLFDGEWKRAWDYTFIVVTPGAYRAGVLENKTDTVVGMISQFNYTHHQRLSFLSVWNMSPPEDREYLLKVKELMESEDDTTSMMGHQLVYNKHFEYLNK